MHRTIDDIESEERQLKRQLIDIDVEIKNYPYPFPDFIEDARLLDGTYPTGYKTVRMLKTKREAIQLKLVALEEEKKLLPAQHKKSGSSGAGSDEDDVPQQELVVRRFLELQAANPGVSTTDILDDIADELNKNVSAVKKSYYDGIKAREKKAKKSS